MGHPAIGALPEQSPAGFADTAERLRNQASRCGARALEVALRRDPTLHVRHGDEGLQALLRDTEIYLERLARSLETADSIWVSAWADWVAPVYRRRKVPMDDLITLSEGLREATAAVLTPLEQAAVDDAIAAAIRVFRQYRQIAGDARRRNRLISFLYKGAGS